jgi:pimeloyl-ACP methyl ester carboxylesterase
VLTNSLPNADVDALVYPQYATRGDLAQAVTSFCQWLLALTTERQRTTKEPVCVILLGHSMGGLVGKLYLSLYTRLSNLYYDSSTNTFSP